MGVSRLALFGLAACGSVSAPATPDAITPDVVTIDAPAPGPVTVTTQTRFTGGLPPGTALGNVAVVAVRPDGMLADMQVTDGTSGMATLNAYDGDSVTALYPHMTDAGADLTTFMGVKHGDSLTFGLKFGVSGTNNSIGTMTITWPAIANAGYDVFTSCQSAGVGGATSFADVEYQLCHHEPMDVVVNAYDQTSGLITQSGTIPAVAFADGSTTALAQWHPGTTTKTLGLTGLPTEVTQVNMVVQEMVNDRVFFGFGYSGAPSNGQYTSPTFQWPGQGTREWVRSTLSRTGPWYQMYIMDNVAPTTAPYTSAAPALPPWMTSNTIASGPAQMAAWFPVGDGPQKGTVLRVSWSHNGAPYVWTFIVPPGVTAINFPKLPDAIAMNAPHPEDTASVQFVRTFDIPELASYDDVRKLPESEIVTIDQAPQLGLLKRVIMNL
jgi:hypothetical protein